MKHYDFKGYLFLDSQSEMSLGIFANADLTIYRIVLMRGNEIVEDSLILEMPKTLYDEAVSKDPHIVSRIFQQFYLCRFMEHVKSLHLAKKGIKPFLSSLFNGLKRGMLLIIDSFKRKNKNL
ncbi:MULTISPECIES: hypothetical protein [unclassified Gilliamella]|uniref:hypothetical protein n=1 Tax=unclassified Gilliamella TaxID=2685620 RepID=UPI00080E03FA|nr:MULTISPECIES: hypothetical protein [Gilliamella]MCX8574570.1 hypothetical protein [Gilliamella sp. B3831]MCX8576801.1 hypothetical protein [Gilliamella sp. B3815]MCX8578515.1 hypothetical protein [Gilliamella sp. B2717]MCX8589217.1 hypothetical protein [Gilliamella sp. B3812]MCX8603791.1 hypothetical protein [Gilliamella sp. B3823]